MALSKKERKLQEDLVRYIRTRFEQAKSARVSEYERMQTCLRQVRGDDIECLDLDPELRVKLNITSPIVRGVVGLMRDVFSNSIENPFVIKSTPVADLNERAQDTVTEMLNRSLAEIGAAGMALSKEQAFEIGSEIRNATQVEINKLAEDAAEKMNIKVQDDLRDAGWTGEFGDFLYNFVVYPTAFLKAPVVQLKKVRKWSGDRLVVEDRIIRSVENISPFDIYPAPHTKKIQDAEYIIERRKMSKADLFNLLSTPGFNYGGVDAVLDEYPGGYIESYEDSTHGEEVKDEVFTSDGEDENTEAQGFYDTIGFYGSIRGDILQTYGIEVSEPRRTYEAEIWLVGNYIIKAKLNPDILGRRPFFAASFEPIPGTIWGESPVSRLTGIHQICLATVTALVRNMSYSSGVQGEVDPERILDDDDDPRIIQPNQMRLVDGDVKYGGAPAIRYYTVPNIVGELMRTLEAFQQQAYEAIGIPRVAFGSSQNLGTVGRTSGGVAMILNQASKSVKFALRIVEEQIIEGVIQTFIDHRLMFDNDPSIKGDIRVYARGVSGIVEKENKESKLEWVVQSISSWVGQPDENQVPIVPGSAIRELLATLFESAGIDVEKIFPNHRVAQAVNGIPSNPTTNPLVDGSPLDGRSAAAQTAINNQAGVGSNQTGQPGAL